MNSNTPKQVFKGSTFFKRDFISWRNDTKYFLIIGIALTPYVLYNWHNLSETSRNVSQNDGSRTQQSWNKKSKLWILSLVVCTISTVLKVLDVFINAKCLQGFRLMWLSLFLKLQKCGRRLITKIWPEKTDGAFFKPRLSTDFNSDTACQKTKTSSITKSDSLKCVNCHTCLNQPQVKSRDPTTDDDCDRDTTSYPNDTADHHNIRIATHFLNKVEGRQSYTCVDEQEMAHFTADEFSDHRIRQNEQTGGNDCTKSTISCKVNQEKRLKYAKQLQLNSTDGHHTYKQGCSDNDINNIDVNVASDISTKTVPVALESRGTQTDCLTLTTVSATNKTPLVSSKGTLTDSFRTDSCVGTHDRPCRLVRHCSTTTTSSFLLKVSRRAMQRPVARRNRQFAQLLLKWNKILVKYRQKLTSMTETLSRKDQMLGGTTSRIAVISGEIKEAMVDVRSTKERLNTQCKLNAALLGVIESKSENPNLAVELGEQGIHLLHE